ncbi:hypothetical protein [Ruminococcus bicirculans (ex Wegman et al. 2014)]|uniref:hypothetical protein n=1 Tax=Ruminococcus bicirculans (ex Wegman et al. 2014) TaxID=1160721 RepID=UPI0026740D08
MNIEIWIIISITNLSKLCSTTSFLRDILKNDDTTFSSNDVINKIATCERDMERNFFTALSLKKQNAKTSRLAQYKALPKPSNTVK